MIWASIAEKGGSGKTTFVTNLAVSLASQSKRVLALDFDPMGSLTRWGAHREGQDGYVDIKVLSASSYGPIELLENLDAAEFDDIVLDVPGSDNESLREALMVSDVAVMPCVPGGFDFTSYQHTLEVIEKAIELKADTPNPLRAVLYLNRVRPNSTVARLTRGHMSEHVDKVHLLESELGTLDDFVLAGQMGLGVEEYARTGRASKHTRQLMRELSTYLEEGATS